MLFRSAAEARSLGLPVIRLIVTAFARPATAAELQPWIARVRAGEDLGWVASALARSDEFLSRHGPEGRIDAAYIQSLFWAIDGRDPAESEAERLLAQPHASRAGILGQVSQSARAQAAISLERHLYRDALPPADDAAYQLWLDAGGEVALGFAGPPPSLPVSLVIEAPPGRPDLLEETLGSLHAQTTPHWEALVLGGGPATGADPRVRWVASEGSRAESLNRAAATATGAVVGFIAASDLLAPQAIEAAARCFAAEPGLPLLYTDEDCIDGDGVRSAVQLKPAWTPDLLLYGDALGQLALFDRAAMLAAGGLAAAAGAYAAMELALRLTQSRPARHLPGILFHRGRLHAGRDRPFPRARAGLGIASLDGVVERHLRQHRPGLALGTRLADAQRWPRLTGASPEAPSVSVVALGSGARHAAWLEGLMSQTDYPDREFIAVQAAGAGPIGDPRVRNVAHAGPARWAAMANTGAAAARGELIVLLMQDVVPADRAWLRTLVSAAQRTGAGVAAPRLLRPDGSLLDTGVALGPHGAIAPIMAGAAPTDPGYRGLAAMERDVAAIGRACFLVRRTLWQELDGLDAAALPHAWAEIDLCLRARAAGWRVIWDPEPVLTHYGATDFAPTVESETDRAALTRRWPAETSRDPCLNPMLRATAGTLALAPPPAEPGEAAERLALRQRLEAAEDEVLRLRLAWPRAELQRLHLEREALLAERAALKARNETLRATVAALPTEMIGVARALRIVPLMGRALRHLVAVIGRTPQRRAVLRQRRADYAVIDASPLFDRAWYTAQCMEDEPGAPPVSHYIWRGSKAGKNPHPLFDRAWYAARTPDLGLEDPWAHYIRAGMAADADPHPLFDVRYYLTQAPEAAGRALLHYMSLGPGDTRSPAPLFDPAAYGASLAHYAQHGAPADADPHPVFACRWYRAAHLGADATAGCLAHWLREGAAAGLPPNPFGLDPAHAGRFAGPDERPAITAIVTRGVTGMDTARTLLSLAQQGGAPVEAIVLGEGALPADLGPIGTASDRAEAVRAAGGTFLLVLGAASVAHPGLAGALLRAAGAAGRVDLVACRVQDGDGAMRSLGQSIGENGTLTLRAGEADTTGADAPDPAAMLVRREAWTWFDDGYESDAYAVADLALACRRDGGRVALQPAGVVSLLRAADAGDQARDRARLMERWSAVLAAGLPAARHVLILADAAPMPGDAAGLAIAELQEGGARVSFCAPGDAEGLEIVRPSELEDWLGANGAALDEIWSFRNEADVPAALLRRRTAARVLQWDRTGLRPAPAASPARQAA